VKWERGKQRIDVSLMKHYFFLLPIFPLPLFPFKF
jgi:hypothetical protein